MDCIRELVVTRWLYGSAGQPSGCRIEESSNVAGRCVRYRQKSFRKTQHGKCRNGLYLALLDEMRCQP